MSTQEPQKIKTVMDDPVYKRMFARMAELQEEAKNRKESTGEDSQSRFEQDILHNRYLLNGSTSLDGASIYNPEFKATDIWKHLWDEFRTSHFRNCLLLGSPGNGKTFATLAFINTIASVSIQVGKIQHSDAVFIKPYRICEMISDSRKWGDEIRDLRRKRILFVDDLGTEPTGFKGADFIAFLDDLFDERSKRPNLMSFFTSNGTTERIKELYGERFASRFSSNGYFYESKGADLRRNA